MVIQGYNVNVSSQRTFMSIQSTSVSAANSQNNAHFTGSTGQGGNKEVLSATAEKPQNQNNQGQNQNGNGNGNGNTGLGQNGNNSDKTGLGHNENGNGNVGLGQNKNGNIDTGSGQNVNTRDRSRNGDVFRSMLENAREERVGRSARNSHVSHAHNARHGRMPTSPQELRSTLAKLIYEMLTGRFSKLRHNTHPQLENTNEGHGHDFSGLFFGAMGMNSLQRVQGAFGAQFESFQFESETVSYQASGVVHTADGRTITVDINMHMSRQFMSFMSINGNASLPVDPLVINYGGTAASLMGERFLFDLTSDGNLDSLAVLGEGSGFLAIDRNGDGIINDGSELFGPATGCGFSELRKYDTDGNGWIDENDEIFDKLVVWRRDKDGNDIVYTLRELGIGAIFLGDISTEFSFKGENNETLGMMRSTSFFIKQCGGSGTLSHVDMVLESA